MNLQQDNCINSLSNNKVENHFGVGIQELPFINKINVRIDINDNQNIIKCGKLINAILPIQPNTYVKNDNVKAIWLGPNEWLITNNQNLYNNLKSEIGDMQASVTDVSENRTVIRISGEKIFKLLSKFLVLDLEKNLPDESSCAQTLFVKVPVLLVRNNNEKQIPEIDIFTNRSHANYIYNLIVDGSQYLDF
jgi:sarcosine oxidase subunit gamma